uniref:Porin n=1 Tax=Eiseniibacteriota bacterium TaxID=2212470 RepID=A0A832I0F6_UNCEI
MLHRIRAVAFAAAAELALAPAPSRAVTNPDLSVIGQPTARVTDDAADPARERVAFDPGETELVFDAALNPFARGWFVIAFGDEGAEVEEAFLTVNRGLPGGLGLKAGQYLAGFGKVNGTHPHAYPFGGRFRVLEAFLPGEESFKEVGVQLSRRFAPWGDAALTASVDLLQGDAFRREREPSGAPNDPLDATAEGDRADEPRPAALGRLAAFLPFDDRSGVEIGVNATQGVNNVAAGTRTTLIGADVKAKLWTGERSSLLLQGEALRLAREEAGWDEAAAAYTSAETSPLGFYAFADYAFDPRWNAGLAFERWQDPAADDLWNTGLRAFAGFKLLEETTAVRLDWEHVRPGTPEGATEDPDAVNALTLRVIFSMGPHKAHQF